MPCSLHSQLNGIVEVPDKTGSGLPGKHSYKYTSPTATDQKVVNKRVKHCMEDTSSTDKPTAKCGKNIMATLQNSEHRLVSTSRRTGLLGISCNYLRG